MLRKVCSKCGEEKDILDFHPRPERPIGNCSYCISCGKKKVALYRLKNRDLLLEKDKIKRQDITYRLHRSCKHSARRRGLEFNLMPDDLHIPEKCPYLGVKLTNTIGKGFQDYNPSIDRVDNSKGYTKDNIEIISVLANRMKSTSTKEELVSFARHTLERENISKC